MMKPPPKPTLRHTLEHTAHNPHHPYNTRNTTPLQRMGAGASAQELLAAESAKPVDVSDLTAEQCKDEVVRLRKLLADAAAAEAAAGEGEAAKPAADAAPAEGGAAAPAADASAPAGDAAPAAAVPSDAAPAEGGDAAPAAE